MRRLLVVLVLVMALPQGVALAVDGELGGAEDVVPTLAGIDPATLVLPDSLTFPARDGVTLQGLLYRPQDLPEQARPPLMLMVHGGPTAQARPSFEPVAQYLVGRGFAVFDLNFRGATGFGKTFARLDNGRGVGASHQTGWTGLIAKLLQPRRREQS